MHGKPAGRFSRSPLERRADAETRRVLGPSNVAPDAAAHLEEAWRKMRGRRLDAPAPPRGRRRRARCVRAGRFRTERECADFPATSRRPRRRVESAGWAEFKRAWFALGVRDLSDAQVKAVFAKVGHDARGNMPYDVFVKALVLKSGRVLGLEHIKKGPFEDADDARFMGKITYPQCRRGVQAPSDWLTAGRAITARSASVPTLRLEPDFAHGFPGRGDLGNSLLQTNAGGGSRTTSARWAWCTTRGCTRSGSSGGTRAWGVRSPRTPTVRPSPPGKTDTTRWRACGPPRDAGPTATCKSWRASSSLSVSAARSPVCRVLARRRAPAHRGQRRQAHRVPVGLEKTHAREYSPTAHVHARHASRRARGVGRGV